MSISPQDPRLQFESHFSLPTRPGDELPNVPNNLDDLTDAELMACYAQFVSWLNYAKAQLALAEITEEREANQLELIKSTVLISQWDAKAKGEMVTIAKAKRDTVKEVVDQQNAHTNARAYRKLVDTVFDRCERGAHLLSRELSRRISISPQEKKLYKYIP